MSATDVIEVETLRAQVAYLKEQIEELTGRDMVATLQARLRIQPQCAAILAALTKRGSRIVLYDTIYRTIFEHDNGDGPSMEIVKVQLCRTRAALRKAGAPGEIRTIWGRGYQADQTLCDWVRALVAEPQEMAA